MKGVDFDQRLQLLRIKRIKIHRWNNVMTIICMYYTIKLIIRKKKVVIYKNRVYKCMVIMSGLAFVLLTLVAFKERHELCHRFVTH